MFRRALPAILLALAAAPGLLAAPVRAQSGDPSFRVENNTTKVVNEVYASPSSERNWGHDRLGNEVVGPGASHIIRLPSDGNCNYDVRIVYQGGSVEERRNLDTCAMTDLVLGTAGPAAGRQAAAASNPSFNLVNRTGRVIEQIFASPASRQDWGPDRLGDTVVQPGATYPIRLPLGECSYDLRFVLQGGQAKERRNIDTCSISNYVVE